MMQIQEVENWLSIINQHVAKPYLLFSGEPFCRISFPILNCMSVTVGK